MASEGSAKLAFGIRKATKADLEGLQRDIHSFNMTHPENYKVVKGAPGETTFIAFSGKTILGFITASESSGKELYIESFYNRLGYDRKGIGSKLLGKINAYAVARGFRLVSLAPSSGFVLENGSKKARYSHDFYNKKTNYKHDKSAWVERFLWFVKRKRGVRRPRQKPPKGLAPQNLLRKDVKSRTRRR